MMQTDQALQVRRIPPVAPPLDSTAVRSPGAAGGVALRIGYLVPEFPGQTHAFFWREIRALEGLGIHADLVSTRRPDPGIVCHEWSREAMARTTYLYPPGLSGLGSAARHMARHASGVGRCVRAARGIGLAGRSRDWMIQPSLTGS